MRASRPIEAAAWGLSGFAGLCLLAQPVYSSETPGLAPAAKSDRLAVMPAKGDLLFPKPEPPAPKPPVKAAAPAIPVRGALATKLIDVAVRDDGLWLNSFATKSMPLDADACAEIGEAIVASLALPAGAVERLAEEDLMRQTRVCGDNGSMLITCYGGDATLSLRRPQHGDGCGG
jgi:hypothetical protein